MDNLILIVVIGAIVGLAAGYVWKAKKRGVKCVGCPDASCCSGNCGGCQGCAGK